MYSISLTMSSMSMAMSSLRFLSHNVSVSVAGYRFNIVEVETLLVQSQVSIARSIGSFGPLEGWRLVVIVTVSMTADPLDEA